MKVRNKHVLLELLEGGVNFEKVVVAEHLDQDELTQKILSVAARRHIPIQQHPRKKISTRRGGESHEVLVGFLTPIKLWTLSELLAELYEKNEQPFFLLLNRVEFSNNMGIIARSAFGAGVNGLVFQADRNQFFNEETLHFSMGSIARIPQVKTNIFEALKELKKSGIPTFSLDMTGSPYFKENLTGPVAFVLGAEREGLSKTVSKKCDKSIAIPMQSGIDSLNVGVSASIVLYEKVRQERSRK